MAGNNDSSTPATKTEGVSGKHWVDVAFKSERMQESDEASTAVCTQMYLNESRDAPSRQGTRLYDETPLSLRPSN